MLGQIQLGLLGKGNEERRGGLENPKPSGDLQSNPTEQDFEAFPCPFPGLAGGKGWERVGVGAGPAPGGDPSDARGSPGLD